MGKLAMWRAMWLIPMADAHKLFTNLDAVVQTKDITKAFNVAGVTFYAREVTHPELVNLNKKTLP